MFFFSRKREKKCEYIQISTSFERYFYEAKKAHSDTFSSAKMRTKTSPFYIVSLQSKHFYVHRSFLASFVEYFAYSSRRSWCINCCYFFLFSLSFKHIVCFIVVFFLHFFLCSFRLHICHFMMNGVPGIHFMVETAATKKQYVNSIGSVFSVKWRQI